MKTQVDGTRKRRFSSNPHKRRYYAWYRSVRFRRRLMFINFNISVFRTM